MALIIIIIIIIIAILNYYQKRESSLLVSKPIILNRAEINIIIINLLYNPAIILS